MGRWLAVREEWRDVRYGNSSRSGGYVVGYLVTRTALDWVQAPTKAQALVLAPFGTTTVLSLMSLTVDDRDGWLKLAERMRTPGVKRIPLFEGGAARKHFDRVEVEKERQLELAA